MHSPRNKPLKILLYSHDTMGLGHVRRNLLISKSLSNYFPNANILLISGTCESNIFQLPERVDIVTLPSLLKGDEGRYCSKNWDVSLREIIKLRANIIRSTVEWFEPDLMIVDNVVRGACLELDETLEHIRRGGKTRIILGLRDIKDDDQTILREWRQQKYEQFIQKYYNAVWIYGDRRVYDWSVHYPFAVATKLKIHYMGYLDQRVRLEKQSISKEIHHWMSQYQLDEVPFYLCSLGGGQDGFELGKAFAQAGAPEDSVRVLIIGPNMELESREKLHKLAMDKSHLLILDFVKESAALLEKARGVIAMGGYNNVLEILSFEKTALIIPRIFPREEQLIRARHLKMLGLIDMLHPEELTPEKLTAWMFQCVSHCPLNIREIIDINGLGRINVFIEEIFSQPDEEENRQVTYLA